MNGSSIHIGFLLNIIFGNRFSQKNFSMISENRFARVYHLDISRHFICSIDPHNFLAVV